MAERGATRAEVLRTVLHGRLSPVKFGRVQFTYTFAYNRLWHGRRYLRKTIEAIAVREARRGGKPGWLVLTVITKFG